MKKSKKFPLGIQSFEDLRNKNFAYVDKTKFIFELATRGKSYFLSRPRRFGKSLFLSTLEAYFLSKRELFDGLAIQELEDAEENPWQEYPVLYLDFNGKRYNTENALLEILNFHLNAWEKLYSIKNEYKKPEERFKNIIIQANEQTGKQVVILIDEYDKPLLETLSDNQDLNETYRKMLKAFYSVIKSADKYIRFVFLTGVTRFGKVSIFSDLNNLTDISFLNAYSEICGITQEELESNFETEIEILAEENNLSFEEAIAVLKQNYDGYKFSTNCKNIYNPYSILNTFSAKEFKYYWFATGTPTFLVKYLQEGRHYIPDLDGNTFIDEAGLSTYKADDKNPLPILFQAGYLTIKEYNPISNLYRLAYPNDEVRYGFLKNLIPSYLDMKSTETPLAIWNFFENIRDGKVDEFMTRMQSIISNIPYDNFSEKELHLREQNYQAAVYLIFALMGQFTHTEVHCATGRTDCEVETENAIYIFEFKLNGKATAEDALKQIEENHYADKYKATKKKIVLIGANFDEEKRTIGEYLVQFGIRNA